MLRTLLTVLIIWAVWDTFIKDDSPGWVEKRESIDELIYSSPFVVGQDTLEAINTNWWGETVTLENGKVYDYTYLSSRFLDETVKQKIDSLNQ